jgi:hypothetical protein
MKKHLLLLVLFFIPLVANAQYTQIASTGDTVSITGNVTTFVRYGSVADNKWFYKAYTTKTFVVGSNEYTTNPDPGQNPSTFVLQAFETPAVSNFAAPMILVNGHSVVVGPPTVGGSCPTPFSGPLNIGPLKCSIDTTGALNCVQ